MGTLPFALVGLQPPGSPWAEPPCVLDLMDLLDLLDILDLDLSLHLDLYLSPGPGLGPGRRSGRGPIPSNYKVGASLFRSISQLLPSSS